MELRDKKGVLIDLDGVVWRGENPVPGAKEAVATIKQAGYSIRFVSNNSSLGVEGLYNRLTSMGIPAALDEVLAATEALARVLARKENRGTVFMIGSEPFKKELEARGLRVIDEPEEIDYLTDFVVIGTDRDITFHKLTRALRCLDKGAAFAAVNVDVTYPSTDGITPGTGAFVAAVQAMIKREPDIMVGKPNPQMFLEAAKSMDLTPEACLVVGDSLDSDVAAADKAGMPAVLVLTGNSSRDDLDGEGPAPAAVIESIADLPALLNLS